jgi:hypothetical protein
MNDNTQTSMPLFANHRCGAHGLLGITCLLVAWFCVGAVMCTTYVAAIH